MTHLRSVDRRLIKMENIILNGKGQLWMKLDDQWVLMSVKGPMIPRVELNTVHLQQHYSVLMHNRLQNSWCGDYCKSVWPARLPVLTWGSSSIPPGTTSMIRFPLEPRRIQQQARFRTCDTMVSISFTQSISLLQNTAERDRMKPNSALPHPMLLQCTLISLNTHVSIHAFSINFCPLCDSQIQHHACSQTGPRHTAIIIACSKIINSWAWAKMQVAATTVQEDLKSHVHVQKTPAT